MRAISAGVLLFLAGIFGQAVGSVVEISPMKAVFLSPDRLSGLAEVAGGGQIFRVGGWSSENGFSREVVSAARGEAGGWDMAQGELPDGVAWAGASVHEGRLFMVGGVGSEGVSRRALMLERVGGRLVERRLPDLPEGLIGPGVAVHRSGTRHFLLVLGGLSSRHAEVASRAVYELELGRPATWRRLPDLPFAGMMAPLMLETFNEVVVTGGYALEGGQLFPRSETWTFARTARDGQSEPGWRRRSDLPEALAEAAVVKSGQAHFLVLGGNAAQGSLEAFFRGEFPLEPRDEVWSFHAPTDTWVLAGRLPQAVVGGAAMMSAEDRLIFAGGWNGEAVPADSLEMRFPHSLKQLALVDWLVIAGYFGVTALIGFWFSRRQQDADSFALGGRKVKWWAAAISSTATGVSTISFMAIPALIACTSLVHTFPAVFIIPGMFVSAYLTMPMLRRLELTSVFEYLERRFGRGLRLFGSLNGILVQVMGRIGVVVMLPALAISSMTGIDPFYSVIAMGVLTTLYSAAGGFEAVIWTDVFQGFLMLAGFLVIAGLAFLEIPGGWATVWMLGQEMERFTLVITKFDFTVAMVWFSFLGFVLGLLAFASDQATAQRVLATPLQDVRKFAFLTGTCGVLVAVIAGAVGLLLFGFFKTHPEILSPVMKNDQMVPIFLVSEVPPMLAGLLLATLFAASMSTISSSVNSCSVLVAEDFYRLFRPQAGGLEVMRVMQVTTLAVGLIGTGFALWLLTAPMPTLWEAFTRLMALVGGGFGGVFILGMLTRRTSQAGALVGVVISFAVAYLLQVIEVPVHYTGIAAITTLSCVVTGYLSSLVLPRPEKNLLGLTLWDLKPVSRPVEVGERAALLGVGAEGDAV